MSPTHDYTISNASGSSVRNDLQNALRALNSNNSGSSAPADQLTEGSAWADTSNHLFKRQDQSGNWISLRKDNGTVLIPDGTASSPGLTPSDDPNTGLFSPAADQLAIAANGSARLTVTSSAITATEPIGIPDGSASLPGLTPSDDTNTGLFSGAADTLNFSTGGSERLKIDTAIIASTDLSLDNRKSLRLYESGVGATNYIALRAPATIGSNVTLDFPATAGTSGQVLATNGSGTLSWVTDVPEAVKLKTARTINGTAFDGSANISIDTGDFLSYVSTTDTTARAFSSDTWTDVGLSITYTPQSSSSKIILTAYLNMSGKSVADSAVNSYGLAFMQILEGNNIVGERQCVNFGHGHSSSYQHYTTEKQWQWSYYVEYSNTNSNAKTFKVQLYEDSGVLLMNDGINYGSTGIGSHEDGLSYFTLMEVK